MHPYFNKALTNDSDNGSKNRVVGALTKVNHVPFSLPEAEPDNSQFLELYTFTDRAATSTVPDH